MQVPDSVQDYPDNVKEVIAIGKKFPNPTGLFRIELKPKNLGTQERLLRSYVDTAGFICVCEQYVTVFIKGDAQVFLLDDIEKVTFQGKDVLGIDNNAETTQE